MSLTHSQDQHNLQKYGAVEPPRCDCPKHPITGEIAHKIGCVQGNVQFPGGVRTVDLTKRIV